MQQQKLLLTILSVAILVLVLLVVGMFVFIPEDCTEVAKGGRAVPPVEWSKSPLPPPTPVHTAMPVPQDGGADMPKPPVQMEKPAPNADPAATTPVPVPEKKPAGTAEVKKAAPEKEKVPVAEAKKATQPTKPATKKAEQPKPAKATKPAEKKVEAADKASYWVQVGSYSSTDTADKVRRLLMSKGYNPTIQTVSSNGKTFHRVKVGPCPTKARAEAVLKKIKALDGMSGSFITEK